MKASYKVAPVASYVFNCFVASGLETIASMDTTTDGLENSTIIAIIENFIQKWHSSVLEYCGVHPACHLNSYLDIYTHTSNIYKNLTGVSVLG